MRKIMGWLLVCGAVGLAAPHAVAGDREEAVAVIDAAIKAHGGTEALTKRKRWCGSASAR